MCKLHREVSSEKERHEIRYNMESDKKLQMHKHDWLKFDNIKTDVNSYTFSVKSLGKVNGKRVLDLACGTGWFSVILAKRGAIVDGIDISGTAIDIAIRRANINNVDSCTRFRQMSFYELDFSAGCFDVVIGHAALHHAGDKARLCDELHRVLKPGGRIVFNEPFGNSMLLERMRLFVPVKVNEDDRTHWRDQIKYKDLDLLEDKFSIVYREFQLFSRVDRFVKKSYIIDLVGRLDLFLLEKIHFLRSYARTIVIILTKK